MRLLSQTIQHLEGVQQLAAAMVQLLVQVSCSMSGCVMQAEHLRLWAGVAGEDAASMLGLHVQSGMKSTSASVQECFSIIKVLMQASCRAPSDL